jgi:hypothetical protein
MTLTRRSAAHLLSCAAARALAVPGWTSEWDATLIDAAVARAADTFDAREMMLRARVGPEYRYHTTLRSVDVHPTRETLNYAWFLFEAGRAELGVKVADRVLALQDTDPASKWYGLWSYYLEEPLPRMAPADWNWADFNGSYLVLMELRHGSKMPAGFRERVRQAIRHAAVSIRRRNVGMGYTNIAVQGTFVTLAAGELLGDAELKAYATDRLRRFCAHVDETGSFAEYNSPTYASVTLANITRMLMNVRDEASLSLVRALHRRAWLHLASHWHAPTRQLAGPMSRAYSTDIGRPLWLQKALDNRIVWTTLAELKSRTRGGDAEVATLDLKVPADMLPMFLDLRAARQHREVFIAGRDGVRPVQGTTFLSPVYTLGSANRSDFWVQRRPLLAYWGAAAKYAQLRFLKDDYDFSSALLYSVQEANYVLAAVCFRTPGGDKHISLDPLPPEFPARLMRLRLDLPEGMGREIKGRTAFAYDRDVRIALAVREVWRLCRASVR